MLFILKRFTKALHSLALSYAIIEDRLVISDRSCLDLSKHEISEKKEKEILALV